MNSFGQTMAFGVAAMVLGATLMLGMILALAMRYSNDRAEGCALVVICTVGFVVSIYFFVLAVSG